MYSLSTLSSLNKTEEKKYFRSKPLKKVVSPDDVTHSPDYSGGEISKIASHFRVKLHDTFFVDSSGCGSRGEPALTFPDFSALLSRILQENTNRTYYSAITGIGQFQVYVTLFYKEAKKGA